MGGRDSQVLAGEPTQLVGRADELAIATAALAGRGCVIVGAAGVGKSRLATEAAGHATSGRGVERVIATESARALPFGAFSHLLPAESSAAANPIPAMIDALRKRSPAGAVIVLVDDAHHLDNASAALVLALASTGAARPLLTVRSGIPLPDAIVALWKDRGALRLDLQPLARDEVALLVDAILGGPAEGAVHRRAFELSEGNPLYVRELLADAERSGALFRVEGLWRWSGVPIPFDRLSELIATRTKDLEPGARHALELLALASPLPLAELRRLAGSEATEQLERAGLAVVVDHGEARATLTHPLYGEVVRGELAVEARRRLQRELAVALAERSELTPFELIRIAAWKLEAGEPDAELCLRASRSRVLTVAGVPGTDWGGTEPEIVLRLADAAGPGLEPALYAARALMAIDRFAEVEERLAPLEEEAATHADPDLVSAYLRARALSLGWRGAGAQARALIERAAGWQEGRDWAALRATLAGWSLFYDGFPAQAIDELEPLASDPGLAATVRLDLLVALVVVLSRRGLTDRCEALEPEIDALVEEVERDGIETGWGRYAVDGLARVDAARGLPAVAERLAAGIARAEARGDEVLAAALAWVAGRLELVRGHTADAARLLARGAEGLAAGDPRNALGPCLSDLARAHATRADLAGAEAALARAESEARERPGMRRFALQLGEARAWVEAARGRPEEGAEQLLRLAEAAGEVLAVRAEAAYGALRLGAGARACAELLAPLAERMQSELVCAYFAHAKALAAGDGRAQLEAARRFAELEADLLCAEAAAEASRALLAEGRHASSREAAALATKHAGRCQGAATPAISRAADLVELTGREREIAVLAAAGHSNAEIADQLVISVRTVETHLYRVFRKVGIGERERLAELLG